ncbi:MAG TPA: universal stress protein [Steroidobacteraceae bacterium]|nr:universal stress protein [Steroidobacteraceae bacterium]
MAAIRRILVAVKDPDARSSPALAKGAQLARALDADLELFHGIATPLYVDPYSADERLPDTEHAMRARRLRRMESIAARLRKTGLRVRASVTWDFPIYEAIVRCANRQRADLIVAERHAGRHILPGMLQLTDWELLRISPVPVLLVKKPRPYDRPAVLAAVDPAHALAKPALLDKQILDLASTVARALRGPLHAVHAFAPFPADAGDGHLLSSRTVQAVITQRKRTAQRMLARELRAFDVPAARRHLVGRHPIDAIEQTARSIGSDMVVMGAISRSGLKRFIFGNTAEALLDSLPCDLLIVKPRGIAPRIQAASRGVRFLMTPQLPAM